VHTAYWTGSQWRFTEVTTTDNNYDYGEIWIDEAGNWNIIGSFIDGPQPWLTGGELGLWRRDLQPGLKNYVGPSYLTALGRKS
jgi:hypothetical protein